MSLAPGGTKGNSGAGGVPSAEAESAGPGGPPEEGPLRSAPPRPRPHPPPPEPNAGRQRPLQGGGDGAAAPRRPDRPLKGQEFLRWNGRGAPVAAPPRRG